MKKKIKTWLHLGSTSDIREFTVSKTQLAFLMFVPLMMLLTSAYVGYDYSRLKKASFSGVTSSVSWAIQAEAQDPMFTMRSE